MSVSHGCLAGRTKNVKPAKEIMDEMITEALQQIHWMAGTINKSSSSKL
jgi:hypothetical protein